MRNVLGVVELSDRENGFIPVFLYSAFFILIMSGTTNSLRMGMVQRLQIASLEAINLIPGRGDQLRKEVFKMQRVTKDTIDTYKAMILDMNECQLRFALLMIINGADPPYAIDQAIAIHKEING